MAQLHRDMEWGSPSNVIQSTQMDLAAKSALLHQTLRDLNSVLVAYSGGTDSAYLAYAAHQALGDNMLAVIADSASLPPRRAPPPPLAFTAEHRIPTHILVTAELDNPATRRNDAHRCFHCKDELFTQMESERNAPRHPPHRLRHEPSTTRLRRSQPSAPASRPPRSTAPSPRSPPPAHQGRDPHPRPRLQPSASGTSQPPPASPHASSMDKPSPGKTSPRSSKPKKLSTPLGFPQVRVRHHGDLARIEIAREDLPRALNIATLDRITAALKPLGFLYVALDTQGYRSAA